MAERQVGRRCLQQTLYASGDHTRRRRERLRLSVTHVRERISPAHKPASPGHRPYKITHLRNYYKGDISIERLDNLRYSLLGSVNTTEMFDKTMRDACEVHADRYTCLREPVSYTCITPVIGYYTHELSFENNKHSTVKNIAFIYIFIDQIR